MYRVLVADPPWPTDFKGGFQTGAAKGHYQLLTLPEIEAFPLPPMADDAILFLWRVASLPVEPLLVCQAWGFKPKSELVWVKKTSKGNRHFGQGRYTRAEHETCIIAARGRGASLIKNHSTRSTFDTVFDAPTGQHSQKPEEFYRIVESLVGGPYAELFARRRRVGWNCFGDECPAP